MPSELVALFDWVVIVGASAKWREDAASKRKDFRNTNYNLDIKGAQHDTIKHSIISTRNTHPLQPVYQSLDGGGEVLEPCVQPLIPANIVASPTLRSTKTSLSMSTDKLGFSLGGDTLGPSNSGRMPSSNSAGNIFSGPPVGSVGSNSGRMASFSPTASSATKSASMSFASKFNDTSAGVAGGSIG